MQVHQFQTIEEAKAYALAGNATITLESLRTQTHFTYKVRAAKEEREGQGPVHFVQLLTNGSADGGEFNYLGMIQGGVFRLTKASRAGLDAPTVKAFSFFMKLTQLHPELIVHHEGRCGRCGRTLTVPDSIRAGIGPECAGKMD
ncbi:MAG TPA: DUF6011 domain-containing protein [Candidatus Angelobacter sp.]|nr:DUF6011 domain-containing protein [Candidatus Angelobacter sp.]